jgi:dTDP-4-amino-4,6-dideoxygalactose transaminase
MGIPLVDLRKQYRILEPRILESIRRLLERGDFITGEELRLFEEAFASYIGVRFAVGVASGTEALHLSLRACGIGEGDEVLVPANTFIATALAVTYTGATPVPVEVNPETYNVNPVDIAERINARTRAIIPVHLYGHPADMDPVLKIAGENDLRVIEDAAQAHGARYRGKRVGSLGDIGCFSFYPAKNLGACGDGGIVVTDDEDLADRIRILRNYGQKTKNRHDMLGFNSRLDTLQAAILRIKLEFLDEWNAKRRAAAAAYRRALDGMDLVLPAPMPWAEPVYHLYVVRTPRRDALRSWLREREIATGVHYPTPVHLHPCYAGLGYREGAFPVAEKLCGEILSLPLFPEIAEEEITHIADAISSFFSARRGGGGKE